MRAFIIEDEIPAREKLIWLLEHHCPDVDIVGQAGSITGAVEWLEENTPDLILMDVELSDGLCFEIFKRTEVTSNVVIVTAYDSYAIRAFKVNSVDYLLKPVDADELVAAVDKCRRKRSAPIDMALMEQLLSSRVMRDYKKRFSAQIGDNIISVESSAIAYFYVADKAIYMLTNEGDRYILDTTLGAIEESVNPRVFCRVSRNCIASFSSIKNVSKYFNGKLKITTKIGPLKEIIVSRQRAQSILDWLDGQ